MHLEFERNKLVQYKQKEVRYESDTKFNLVIESQEYKYK
jgi:hypothetical protein